MQHFSQFGNVLRISRTQLKSGFWTREARIDLENVDVSKLLAAKHMIEGIKIEVKLLQEVADLGNKTRF